MNISVSKQLSIGFGLLILLFIIAGLVNINRLQTIESSLKEITEAGQVAQDAAEEMEINLIGTGFGLLGFLHDHDPLHLTRIENDGADFEEFRSKFDQLADTQELKALSQRVNRGYAKLKKKADDLIELETEVVSKLAVFQELLLGIDSVLDDKMQASLNPNNPQAQRKLRAAMEMEINANGIAKGLGNYLRTPRPEFAQRVEKDIGDFKNALLAYEGSTLSADEKGWAREAREIFEKMALHARELIDLEGDIRKGLASFVDMRRELDDILDDEIQIETKKELLAEETAAFTAIDTAFTATWISLVVGLLVAILLGVYLSRDVLRQIGGEPVLIAGVTAQVAKGDLDIEIPGEAETSTGVLASVRTMIATLKDVAKQANTIASGDYTTDISPRSNKDELGIALQDMNEALRQASETTTGQDWLKTGFNRLNDVMRGDLGVADLGEEVISEVASYLDAQLAAVYLVEEVGNERVLALASSYAYTKRKNLSNRFALGEGLVGQCALEKQQILVSNVPEDYVKVTSGLGEATPRFIAVTPILHEGRVMGVIEIGSIGELSDLQLEYMNQAMPALALNIQSAEARKELASSLEESQAMAEELKSSNEELEEQTQLLQQSEERLKAQQEELQAANEEMEEKNELLEVQKREVEVARQGIEDKAEELALASKYKSEFLANMSHELRTPLNSLLLLAQALTDNKEGNLTDEQVGSARIIHGSGSDLLTLINEILDLSKIEAGRMTLHVAKLPTPDLADGIRSTLGHLAEEKGLELDVAISDDAPAQISTDRQRLEQVLRNLISNAIKFTEEGSVTVTLGRPMPEVNLSRSGLSPERTLSIAVKDTGIGIAPEQQKVVFEAFQQADGGTARKYGGTGLGLSISRELVRLLGGEIQLESEPGLGSTFTLYLPLGVSAGRKVAPGDTATAGVSKASEGTVSDAPWQRPATVQIEDDRERLEKDDRVILIIEDDPSFAEVVRDKCHERGFKCLTAPTGETGLELASKHLPAAVILDIRLPGMDGWAVLSALKDDTRTRHIPVHVVSVEEASTEALRKGAVGHAVKPLDQEGLEETFRRLEQVSAGEPRRVLVVEDDAKIRRRTVKLIGNGDVKVDEAETGAEAIEALRSGGYNCVVLDLTLPDMDGGELLAQLEREGVELPPVIVHTARDLTREEEMGLREHAESIVIKDVRSQERLLDEVSLFLHRVVSQMPVRKRKIIRDLHDTDELLRGKKVLIVDDDMRTTFAVSRLLSERGMKPLKAENGERALRFLEEQPDVALVLMDIMMPVMDGYETMKRIRAQERFRKLSIIALTAKAMPEDREKCLAAGANDYLPKPVDPERLISMMRVWLYR